MIFEHQSGEGFSAVTLGRCGFDCILGSVRKAQSNNAKQCDSPFALLDQQVVSITRRDPFVTCQRLHRNRDLAVVLNEHIFWLSLGHLGTKSCSESSENRQLLRQH